MLSFGLPCLRNLLELPWYKRIFDNKSAYLISELLHNIPSKLSDKEVDKLDVYFLLYQGKFFIENYNNRSDFFFLKFSDLILELYELIQDKNLEIEWIFPDDVKMLVYKFREKNNTAST